MNKNNYALMKRATYRNLILFAVAAIASVLTFFVLSPSEKVSISKMEMHLSAFGVEADDFPSIKGNIDFTTLSGLCKKSYYNPAFKDSTYQLSKEEIKKVLALLQHTDLKNIKKEYATSKPDQPASTVVIYTSAGVYTIKDYGLQGDRPLPDLYKIIYKF